MLWTCNVNEEKNCWIYGEDLLAGEAFTIASAVFEVLDPDDVSLQAEANATISDNTTASPDIYGLVDGSNLTADKTFKVLFTIVIGDETYETIVHGRATETKIA